MDKIEVKFLPLKVGKIDEIHFINIASSIGGADGGFPSWVSISKLLPRVLQSDQFLKNP